MESNQNVYIHPREKLKDYCEYVGTYKPNWGNKNNRNRAWCINKSFSYKLQDDNIPYIWKKGYCIIGEKIKVNAINLTIEIIPNRLTFDDFNSKRALFERVKYLYEYLCKSNNEDIESEQQKYDKLWNDIYEEITFTLGGEVKKAWKRKKRN